MLSAQRALMLQKTLQWTLLLQQAKALRELQESHMIMLRETEKREFQLSIRQM